MSTQLDRGLCGNKKIARVAKQIGYTYMWVCKGEILYKSHILCGWSLYFGCRYLSINIFITRWYVYHLLLNCSWSCDLNKVVVIINKLFFNVKVYSRRIVHILWKDQQNTSLQERANCIYFVNVNAKISSYLVVLTITNVFEHSYILDYRLGFK